MSGSINEIASSKIQKDIWIRYTKNNYFACDISFEEVIESIQGLINRL